MLVFLFVFVFSMHQRTGLLLEMSKMRVNALTFGQAEKCPGICQKIAAPFHKTTYLCLCISGIPDTTRRNS
jgi:hypothetical protein